jgi:hypothetical protein
MLNPSFYWIDKWNYLFNAIKAECGFDQILYANEFPDLSEDIDTLFLFLHPTAHYVIHNFASGLEKYKKPIRVIPYLVDLCAAHNKSPSLFSILDRSDVIFTAYDESFRKYCPGYIDKMVLSPHFFAPYERYASLPFNENPKMKCLLSGNLDSRFYPLRDFLSKNTGSIIDILKWPEQRLQSDPTYVLNDIYAKKINEYFCAIATTTEPMHYLVMKYFEIPAAGTLLLANETEDLKKVGFRPHEHFVPITQDNAISQIADCLSNPDKYQKIRKQGMEFVRSNHSIKNRIKLIKEILQNKKE